LFVKDILFQ